MWSKNAIPVEILETPDPSRFKVSRISVSEVLRSSVAERDMGWTKAEALPIEKNASRVLTICYPLASMSSERKPPTKSQN
jgi:hypothetical protein